MKKNFLKIWLTFILWPLFIQTKAQEIKLPVVLPPSPEAAAITKGGELRAGLYNGAMQATVPIYDLKIGDFTLPISLDYNSNGLKVDEIPSRVGLGWSLDAGGVITRIVNGKPDDLSERYMPATPLTMDYQTLTYYFNLSDNDHRYDSEPDEFRIAAPGLSSKFVLDQYSNAIFIPHSNIVAHVKKVVGGVYDEIVITNTEGIKFYFGGVAKEVTANHNIQGKLSGLTQVVTGFFLRKIELLNKDSINFYYSGLNTRNLTGVTHTVVVNQGRWKGSCLDCPSVVCPVGNQSFTETVSDVRYNSVLLDSITSSVGHRIRFGYINRTDNGGDKRLSEINVYEGDYIKGFRFFYVVPAVASGYFGNYLGSFNERFFLTQIQLHSISYGVMKDLSRYDFDYYDINNLPSRLSYCQDHYGFYNGYNNPTLIPTGYGSSIYGYGNFASANRNSNHDYARAGTLKKITYPTGGYDSISYDGNQDRSQEILNTTVSATVGGQGSGMFGINSFLSSQILPKRTKSAQLFIHASVNPTCTDCVPPEEGIDRLVEVYFRNITDNTASRRLLTTFTTTEETIQLEGNKVYQIELRVRGDYVDGFVELIYDTASTDRYHYVWHPAPGIHVSSISSFTTPASVPIRKHFKYAFLADPNGSSNLPVFAMTYLSNSYRVERSLNWLGDYQACWSEVLSSNSNVYQYYYDNNAIVYTSVLESDDPNFQHGLIEHVFAAESFGGGNIILGDDPPLVPFNTNTWYRGYELATNYYNGNLRLIKSINNYYRVDNAINKIIDAIIVKKKYDWPLPQQGDLLTQSEWNPYDVATYTYQSNWIKLDSTVEKLYDDQQRQLVIKKTFAYNNGFNILPVKIETTNSKAQTITEYIKYPNDFAGVQVYKRMIEKNILSPKVEVSTYCASNPVSKTKTEYFDFSPNNLLESPVLIKPQTISQALGTAPLQEIIKFYQYDHKGYPLEMGKTNDVKSVYIWDYQNAYPVAEIINATTEAVAYTSFESDGKGNWQFSGAPTGFSSLKGITGIKYYDLSSGTISKANLPAASFIVSFWKYGNGSVFVNGSASPDKLGRSADGWTYHEFIVNSPSVIISGTAYIDELRLYPKAAMMKTYTYKPLIGVTSQCDANNHIVYYEYDDFARLKQIKDQDKNIIKTFDYQYQASPNQ